jgi:hypothetical protein
VGPLLLSALEPVVNLAPVLELDLEQLQPVFVRHRYCPRHHMPLALQARASSGR